jgi:addiction module HigA family antidote
MKLSANRLGEWLDVPPNRISEIVGERRAVTADTALRFARAFGTSAEFWMNLQKTFELRSAELDSSALEIQKIRPLPKAG